jgi:rhamnose utilization protein RhaD (predicted bifunctional aldolase and dehydrogenase)
MFVDHTHANAVLSITDQEDSDLFCVDVYGSRMGIVPYIMPGFALAVRAAGIYELKPKVEGLILQKHGIVTFGSSARESYERMIEMVSLAEDRLAKNRKAVFVPAPIPGPVAPLAEIAPVWAASRVKDERNKGVAKPILDFRTGPVIQLVNGTESRAAQAGVVTPDHVIRTKISAAHPGCARTGTRSRVQTQP